MVNTVENKLPANEQVVRAVNLIKKHKLDGLDIYWSKSRNLKSNVFLRPNFFNEMRDAFIKHELLLSIAIHVDEHPQYQGKPFN